LYRICRIFFIIFSQNFKPLKTQDMQTIKSAIVLTICLLSSKILFAQHTGLNEIRPVKQFSFSAGEKKVLPGKSEETAPNGAVKGEDIIGNLALVSLFYQNWCYTDGRYNHNNFATEKGEISDENGSIRLEAYRIYEPTHKASEFLASQHNIYFRFNNKHDYAVYQFSDNAFRKVGQVFAKDVKENGFTKIDQLTVSNLTGSAVYVFVPEKTVLSVYNPINNIVDAGKLMQTSLGDVYKIRYHVGASIFDNLSNNQADTRHYFPVELENSQTAVVWQDAANLSVYVTTIDKHFAKSETKKLPNPNGGFLVAAAGSPKGEVFYFTIFEQDKKPLDATLSKFNIKTGASALNKIDASQKLDMYAYGKETASLAYSGDKLLLMFARTMNKSSDGLNHQGGIAVLFDANNLELLRNFGQTSGHSFDNYLMVNSLGEFIGMDLGDNYPRGINLHTFGNSMQSRVVYTFKTRHGETADCYGIKTFPVYPEISTPTKKYYKWSNDNATYTELGAILETSDGYVVSFLGEPDANGKAINNKEVTVECSRNVGFVKVKKSFTDHSDDIFLSKGINETGGFYTFGGSWSEQKNTGIVWLSNYRNPSEETAKNLKTMKLPNDEILFIWEMWAGKAYKKTLALKTDKEGKPIGRAIDLGNQVRLDRRNDPMVKGGQVLIFSGNKTEQKLEMLIIDVK
jgi:hypothetical protein